MAEEQNWTDSRDASEPVFGTWTAADDPAVSVPLGLPVGVNGPTRRKKLVLHIDLNNTILVSDAVTGQGTLAALDSFLTGVTWGKMSKHGKPDHRRFYMVIEHRMRNGHFRLVILKVILIPV